MSKENILVSACLLGVKCRYDGKDQENLDVLKLLDQYNVIPVCPEQLGGLQTPRDPSEQQDDKVISIKGKNVTLNYKTGAKEGAKLAELYQCKKAYLKSKSPMCGYETIYDGSFSGNLTKGHGILTKLLLKSGIKVTSVD